MENLIKDGVSIILPVYNAEISLDRCISSILIQSYGNFELIIINDGSTDNSGSIIERYAIQDNRIKVIIDFNHGVSNARNIGLRTATKKWIAFCDADDVVEKDWLKTMVLSIGDSDFLASGINCIQTDGYKYKRILKNLSGVDSSSIPLLLEELITKSSFGYLWCKLFLRDIITTNSVYFDPNIHMREDELWCVSYIKCIKTWKTISYTGYNYYLPPTNKYYTGVYYDFLLPIFKEYDIIFPDKYHSIVSDTYYSLLRDLLVLELTKGKKLNPRYIEIFTKVLKSDKTKRAKISQIINRAIITNAFTRFIIKPLIILNKILHA